MGKFKIKNSKKKETKLDIFDKKVDSLINVLIPAIIIMIPVVFILYVLNIHGYLFPRTSSGPIFRLDIYYRYLMYILGVIYLYKVIVKCVSITKSDILLFIFMIFTILSTVFAHNKSFALYGYPNRYEGMFTILFYGFLYLNCKMLDEKNDVKYLIRMLVGVSIVHLLVVICQLTGLYEKIIYMYTSGDAIGLTENCNFLGSLMCLIASISLSGYLLFNKKEHDNYYLFILIVSYSTLLLANSSGPFISFIITLFILLIYLLLKKQMVLKKFITVMVIIVCLYPVCLYKRDTITPELKSNFITVIEIIKNAVVDEAGENTNDNMNNANDAASSEISHDELVIRNLGHGRVRIWSNVWKLIKVRPLLGYGPDNLGLVYEKSSDDNKVADKAHNIYLNIFVSSGVFAMVSYILWVIYAIYLGIKSTDKTVLVLCFGIIAYSIQGFFNINVIEVTPYFYLIMGLMMFLIKEKSITFSKR